MSKRRIQSGELMRRLIELSLANMRRILFANLTWPQEPVHFAEGLQNAQVGLSIRSFIMYRELFVVLSVVLLLTTVTRAGYDRVAYWDIDYPTHWISEDETIEVRDDVEAVGYSIVDADELKIWMEGHIADGELSVLVMCKDVFPVTVVESRDEKCTVRRYLDSGGKVVFFGDIPFWNIGNVDGSETRLYANGSRNILGFETSSAPRSSFNTVSFTVAGIEWGLSKKWQSMRPADPDVTNNLTVLATDDAGNAAAWVKHYLPGDTFRGFVRIWDHESVDKVSDIIRVAEKARSWTQPNHRYFSSS